MFYLLKVGNNVLVQRHTKRTSFTINNDNSKCDFDHTNYSARSAAHEIPIKSKQSLLPRLRIKGVFSVFSNHSPDSYCRAWDLVPYQATTAPSPRRRATIPDPSRRLSYRSPPNLRPSPNLRLASADPLLNHPSHLNSSRVRAK